MKILITGAHFTPAQAVIEELQKYDDIEIVYVGRKHTFEGDKALSAESQILPELGVKFIPIVTGRLRRYISLGTFISLLKIPIGFIQGFWIVLTEQPKVVVSFGGYVGVPVVFAAWLLNIPVLIHDQTLVFGLASTVSAWFASKIAVTFDQKYPFPKDKIILTGNPIRKVILDQRAKTVKKRVKLPRVFITGGNQGSHFINRLIEEKLLELTDKFWLIHQTGDSKFKDYDRLIGLRGELRYQDHYLVQKFFEAGEIASVMGKADLVISRAGANTLLELSYLGIPTIIIPLPDVQKDEQTINAKYFSQAGLGVYLYQHGLIATRLLEEIKKVFKNYSKYQTRAKEARSLVIEDAQQKLTQQILLLSNYEI